MLLYGDDLATADAIVPSGADLAKAVLHTAYCVGAPGPLTGYQVVHGGAGSVDFEAAYGISVGHKTLLGRHLSSRYARIVERGFAAVPARHQPSTAHRDAYNLTFSDGSFLLSGARPPGRRRRLRRSHHGASRTGRGGSLVRPARPRKASGGTASA